MTSILLVEDLDDDYLLLARAFSRAKIAADFIRAKDGLEAKDLLSGILAARPQKRLPAFVLTDIKMPNMNGFELLAWIRAHEYLSRLPVIVLSSSNADVDIAKAYDLGANGYVVKPGSPAETEASARAIEQFWIMHNKGPTFR
jgi:CheY-like chemotaxis protein